MAKKRKVAREPDPNKSKFRFFFPQLALRTFPSASFDEFWISFYFVFPVSQNDLSREFPGSSLPKIRGFFLRQLPLLERIKKGCRFDRFS